MTFPPEFSPYVSGQAYKQAVEVAGSSNKAVEDLLPNLKQEEVQTMVEPGIVGDVDLANAIIAILEGDEVVTPIVEERP